MDGDFQRVLVGSVHRLQSKLKVPQNVRYPLSSYSSILYLTSYGQQECDAIFTETWLRRMSPARSHFTQDALSIQWSKQSSHHHLFFYRHQFQFLFHRHRHFLPLPPPPTLPPPLHPHEYETKQDERQDKEGGPRRRRWDNGSDNEDDQGHKEDEHEHKEDEHEHNS
ncbi:hypothetical protein C8R42DRAFT_639946 [Lentinula raphanica]|nr:hypothetical protein C8R42DRAFT_639946 [Lentinula raphanica]